MVVVVFRIINGVVILAEASEKVGIPDIHYVEGKIKDSNQVDEAPVIT